MKQPFLNRSTLSLALFLAFCVAAVGVTASYTEPAGGPSTYNSSEPVDVGANPQAKTGGLSVYAFTARNHADFKQDLSIAGIIQGGNPGDTKTAVNIGTNTVVIGQLHAFNHLNSATLKHTQSTPQPVCGDAHGDVVLCSPVVVVPPPVDICPEVPGMQVANPDITIDPVTGKCNQVIRATIRTGGDGTFARNTANTAWLTYYRINAINILSVGGTPTTTWPSTSPLVFDWGVCAKWNPLYTGPYILWPFTDTTTSGSNPGKDPVGTCFTFPTSTFTKPPLPYGVGNAHFPAGNNGIRTTAWDSVHGFYQNAFPYSAAQGYTVGASSQAVNREEILDTPDRIILYNVVVPAGYTLNIQSPSPLPIPVDVYLK